MYTTALRDAKQSARGLPKLVPSRCGRAAKRVWDIRMHEDPPDEL